MNTPLPPHPSDTHKLPLEEIRAILREGSPLVSCPQCFGHPTLAEDDNDECGCQWCAGLGVVTEDQRLAWLLGSLGEEP